MRATDQKLLQDIINKSENAKRATMEEEEKQKVTKIDETKSASRTTQKS